MIAYINAKEIDTGKDFQSTMRELVDEYGEHIAKVYADFACKEPWMRATVKGLQIEVRKNDQIVYKVGNDRRRFKVKDDTDAMIAQRLKIVRVVRYMRGRYREVYRDADNVQ